MKNIAIYLLIQIMIISVVYLLASFCELSFDFTVWPERVRVACCLAQMPFSLVNLLNFSTKK